MLHNQGGVAQTGTWAWKRRSLPTRRGTNRPDGGILASFDGINMTRDTLSEAVRRRRMARGWTLDALADVAGLTPNFRSVHLSGNPDGRQGPPGM